MEKSSETENGKVNEGTMNKGEVVKEGKENEKEKDIDFEKGEPSIKLNKEGGGIEDSPLVDIAKDDELSLELTAQKSKDGNVNVLASTSKGGQEMEEEEYKREEDAREADGGLHVGGDELQKSIEVASGTSLIRSGDVNIDMMNLSVDVGKENVLVCGINIQCSPEVSSSFLIEHQFKVKRMENISMDDEYGLVRNKKPYDKGFLYEQESSKTWAALSEDLEDNLHMIEVMEANLDALGDQVVVDSVESSPKFSPR
ncbi:unnamed protein product, partial [Ilex paraguariensis]